MAGANVAMSTSALLRHGPSWLTGVVHRSDGMDGPERVRVGGAVTRLDEPQGAARIDGVRPRQLHQDSGKLQMTRDQVLHGIHSTPDAKNLVRT